MNNMNKEQQKVEANKVYRAIIAPAWKAYQAISAPAWNDYQAKIEKIEKIEKDDIITVKGKRYKLIEE